MVSDPKESEKGAEKPVQSAEQQTDDSATPFPVVGIGASAGGLEALRELFRHLPLDTGMGFVLVQHLDPTHESALTELLSRGTELPVSQVTQGMEVEPNHLYIIPPNADMEIRDGTLQLTPRTATRGQHMPVDRFLRSLAKERGTQAIAVILSGSASDGALGLNEVKAEGGIAFAQDDTAKYDGMPRSAIATGNVDFVLPPQEIADELVRIGTHPYLRGCQFRKEEAVPSAAQDDLLKIFVLLRGSKGIDFSLYKHGTLNRRISRRMALHKKQSLEDYLRYLRENATEVEALFQDILIHVTGFFRDPEAFEALETVVFPALMTDRSEDDPIRIWIPGCSTGEEVYSIAIGLLDFLGDRASTIPIKIFATDISDQAIKTARAGVYPENISGDVPPDRLRRFFKKVTEGYEISKTIRETCIFSKQDLTKDPPFSNLDLISCRNVLIYFGPVLQKKVLPIFHYSMKPTGFLMLGSSEAVGQLSDLFDLKDKKHKIYSKKPTTTPRVFDFPLDDRSTIDVLGGETKDRPPTAGLGLNKEADRLMLEEFSPPGVIVTEDLKIVQVRGETAPYLSLAPGVVSLDVLRMAREGLRHGLREAIGEAKKSGRMARVEGLRVKTNDHYAETNVCVFPLQAQDGEGKCFLVLFQKESMPSQPERKRTEGGLLFRLRSLVRPRGAPARHEASTESVQMVQLRKELDETKRDQQSLAQEQEASNEELRAANEEALSANEELLSTNEELETAKEELQATNEELGTVNEELQSRNVETSQLNDDLINLLESTEIPIIMVGNDLCIRRFTPTAAKALNLISSDVGRPIGDLKPKINVPDLETVIETVVETFLVKEREVQDQEGRWYHMSVRPYRTHEKKVDGAVIALADIHQLKLMEQALRDEGKLTGDKLHRSEARVLSIVQTAVEGIVTMTESGIVETFNPAAEKMFGYEASEVIGKNVKMIMPSPYREEHDGYIANYLRTGEKKLIGIGREVKGIRKDGSIFPLDLSVSEIHDGEGRGFTGIVRDITRRKRAEERLLQSERLAAIGEAMTGLTHESRNILARSEAELRMLRRRLEDHPNLLEFLEGLETTQGELHRLFENVRQYAAPVRINREPHHLDQLLGEAWEHLADTREGRNVRLQEPSGNVDLQCEVDGFAIQQVFRNILENALAACEDPVEIEVEYSEGQINGQPSICTAIRDNGPGLTAAEQPERIFDAFYTTKTHGTGLGLAICQRIVNEHGGEIEVGPRKAQGAEFRLTLPRKQE